MVKPPAGGEAKALFYKTRDATSGSITFLFEFQGGSIFDPWDDASGTLKGDTLTVQYDEIMQHADFEDAVYTLTP